MAARNRPLQLGQRDGNSVWRRGCLCGAAARNRPLAAAVAAEEVTEALTRIAELTGEEVRERVLDRLFSKFCIGK